MESNQRRGQYFTMKIVTLVEQKIVKEDGHPTPSFQQTLDILLQQMQINLSDDGYVLPQQTTDAINGIVNPSNPNAKGNGTIWYDTTLNKFVGLENNILVSFDTTPI